ncbi:MAG: hypothetical protein NTX66_01770 [Candidatus Falkowbacteria bacterium]|nr:hypothetical protein [Candidatus Falkowbacteria bacterium]
MKLIVKKNQLGGLAPAQWLRRAGYALINNRDGGESFARRLGSGFYPRLHLYFTMSGEEISFNLHLDQKKASYEGFNRHSGEYEGELLEIELARLKEYLNEDLFA